MIHHYLRHIVIINKLVSYEYFLNHMLLYELYDLVLEIPYSFDILWQQTRILGLFICLKFVKKRLKLKDIFTLPSEQDNSGSWELSDEELELNKQLLKLLEYYLNNLNK